MALVMLDSDAAGLEFMVRWLGFLFSPGRIILVASLVAAGYLAVSAGNNFLDSFELAENEKQLRAELDDLRNQEEQLTQIRDYLRSDDYVEFMARKVFGLVKPGEKLVVVSAPALETAEDRSDKTWWERLFNP